MRYLEGLSVLKCARSKGKLHEPTCVIGQEMLQISFISLYYPVEIERDFRCCDYPSGSEASLC